MAYIVTSYQRLLTYCLYTQLSDSSTFYFIPCNFSRGMLSTNFFKISVSLLIRVSLLTGQFPDRSISIYSLSLSCFTSSQAHNTRSVVCSPILQGHIELSIILYYISVCCESSVSSGRGLCDWPITHPEESYRVSCRQKRSD
jgi:hypothetical protein